MTEWKALTVVGEGTPVKIGGRDVWKSEWRPTGEILQLPHPAYASQMHRFEVYRLGRWGSPRFAAGELSANVWGFYVPR